MTLILSQPLLADDFELTGADGTTVRLLGEHRGPTLLVFFRGHWCPYCRRYLKKLQGNLPRFRERNIRLLAISPEPPATSGALARELGLEFPILSDPRGVVIDRYGARNGPSSSAVVLPHPAVFLIDADGSIRFRRIDRNFKRRTSMHQIFTAIDEACAFG